MILRRKRLSFLILTFLSILFLHNCLIGQRNFRRNISYISKEVFKSKVEELLEEWKAWSIPDDSIVVQDTLIYAHFNIKPFVWTKTNLISLSTQASVNRLLNTVEVAENWKGRISVSVYTPGTDFTRAKIILWFLQHCLLSSESELQVYFAFPLKNAPVDDPELWERIDPEKCNSLLMIGELLEVNPDMDGYPVNAMRNIATNKCDTPYVIYADNDMVPAPNLSPALQPFLHQQFSCYKCAFIIPIYELNDTVNILPANKHQLLQLIKDDLARPFYWSRLQLHQGSHDPKRWESFTNNTEVKIAYPVLKYKVHYEPAYIARAPIPLFDKRFIGHGFDRSSQMFEMMVAGYKLYLLDNAFLMHRGMGHSMYKIEEKAAEFLVNKERFMKFVKEVFIRYGQTDLAKEMEINKPDRVLYKYTNKILPKQTQTETKKPLKVGNQQEPKEKLRKQLVNKNRVRRL